MNDFFNEKPGEATVITVSAPQVTQPKYLDSRIITLEAVYQRDRGFGPIIYYEPVSFRSDQVSAVLRIRNSQNDGHATNIALSNGLVLVTDLLYDMVLDAVGWK